jgi:hypothetical protein
VTFRVSMLVILAAITLGCARDPSNLLTLDDSVLLSRMCVRASGGTVLWDVEASTPGTRIAAVKYGQVPSGFRQVVPQGVAPRPFVDGEYLSVLMVTDTGLVCHRGLAQGPAGFMAGVWHAIPFDHPKNPKADKAFAEVLACVPYSK